MRPSYWSLGFVMIALGAGCLLMGRYYGVQPTVSTAIVAAALAAGGVALLFKRQFSFWVAIAAVGLTVAFALASMLSGRAVGLQPPVIPLVLGLYICFRLVLARTLFKPRAPVSSDQ